MAKQKNINSTAEAQSNFSVDLEKVTAKWPSSTVVGNTLTNLSFTVLPGELMAIVGQVGSGKVTIIIRN